MFTWKNIDYGNKEQIQHSELITDYNAHHVVTEYNKESQGQCGL